jgi:hypothetical protein
VSSRVPAGGGRIVSIVFESCQICWHCPSFLSSHVGDYGHESYRHLGPRSIATRPHWSKDRIPATKRGGSPRHSQNSLEKDESDSWHQLTKDCRAHARRFRSGSQGLYLFFFLHFDWFFPPF